MTKDTGGPAFPQKKFEPLPSGAGNWVVTGGMTLRDWFAGQALAGILGANARSKAPENQLERAIALAAYSLADAMIAERSKP